MLSELNAIGSEDEAARWAHRRLPEKNKLNDRDAEHIEETFRARLSSFAIDHVEEMAELTGNAQASGVTNVRRRKAKATTLCIDRSALGHPEPRRIRDRQHVRFVARQTCLVCGRHPCDAHHLRISKSRALGRKVSDEFTVPLCRSIIASIVVVMKPLGGRQPVLIRFQRRAPCGYRHIRCSRQQSLARSRLH